METFTFLFTDIEGSTVLLRRVGEGLYTELLAGYRGLIRAALTRHEGKEVDTPGDGFFAVFSSPSACVAAVLDMQRGLAAQDWPAGEQVLVRMGVHTGEASRTADGLVGLEVQFDRQPNRHFAFGAGVHRCLGSHLARRELRVTLTEWHRRIPDYWLKRGHEHLEYPPGLRHVKDLTLAWR